MAATTRAGLDWGRLDRVRFAGGIATPLILFHDAGDHMTPFAVSEKLARALPTRVTLIATHGGNHVESWNVDPARYSEELGRWCDEHGVGKRPVP